MKTRLEIQLQEMRSKIAEYEMFAEKKKLLFNENLKFITATLKSYNVKDINCSNQYIDESIIGEKKLLFRVKIEANLVHLTDKQRDNLEKKLRANKVPMPICPISRTGISLVYHD